MTLVLSDLVVKVPLLAIRKCVMANSVSPPPVALDSLLDPSSEDASLVVSHPPTLTVETLLSTIKDYVTAQVAAAGLTPATTVPPSSQWLVLIKYHT